MTTEPSFYPLILVMVMTSSRHSSQTSSDTELFLQTDMFLIVCIEGGLGIPLMQLKPPQCSHHQSSQYAMTISVDNINKSHAEVELNFTDNHYLSK